MHKLLQRGAAKMDQSSGSSQLNRLKWDDLRIFLACAKTVSFRKAAHGVKLSSSTVVRRIERLEEALGMRLFDRLPEGVILTEEGKSIVRSVSRMEAAFFDVLRKTPEPEEGERGTVTISITEGLGSYWVMPRLVEFQRAHPYLIVNLNCAMQCADVLRMEADLSIQFERPENPDLIVKKLGRMHIYPFAAQSYADIYGLPTNIEEMARHRLVDQISPQLDQGAWAKYLNMDNVEGIVGIRTNVSTALFYAIEKGAGIGALPSYAVAMNAPVIPVDIGAHHQMDIWMAYHPAVREVPRVAAVIEWVKQIFDPKLFPWFRDNFIHPNELVNMAPGDVALNSMRGFYSAKPFS